MPRKSAELAGARASAASEVAVIQWGEAALAASFPVPVAHSLQVLEVRVEVAAGGLAAVVLVVVSGVAALAAVE